MIDPLLFDQARDRIAASGFTPAIQSKIALVLSAAKNGNLMFHASMQWMPNLGVVQQFLISQQAREAEALTLLGRTTHWAIDPTLTLTASQMVAPLMLAWGQIMLPPGPLFNPQSAYRGISLGHAQFARMRLAAIIPDNADPLDPFVVALQRIEQENGRMLQTQIRLLKNVGTDVPLEEREALVEKDQELVDDVVSQFLAWLAAP
jgi:hypothetical protein